jgi:hypothetical protein
VALPGDLVTSDGWVEVGVYPGVCPEADVLKAGLPPGSSLSRTAFRPRDADAPPVGTLPPGKYAFAAVVRQPDCKVVGTGCSNVDLSGGGRVEVRVGAVDGAGAACTTGSVCRSGRCVPSVDAKDPNIGSGCSLQLLGAGPLHNPIARSNLTLSAPAIVPRPGGFLIAYREWSGTTGAAQLVLMPVDETGGALEPFLQPLAGRCATAEEADGVGAAWSGDHGLIAVARAPCTGSSGGLELFEVSADGAVAASQSHTVADVTTLSLGRGHALAATDDAGGYVLGAVKNGTGVVWPIRDLALGTPEEVLGGSRLSELGIAATERMIALVGAGSIAEGDGGSRVSQALRVQQGPAGTAWSNLPSPTVVEGAWSALSAQGTRVALTFDGTSLARPFGFRVFDLGRPPGPPDGHSPEGRGKVLFADVTQRQDRLFFFVGQKGSLALSVYERATTTPSFLREVFLGSDPRVPALRDIRDGLVAVAANDTRVAVVWMTARNMIVTNDKQSTDEGVSLDQARLGGYAVFACRSP